MKSKKVIPIIKNDLERSIKNKWFVILNIIMLIITVGGLNFNNIKNLLKDKNVDFSSIAFIFVEDNENLAYDKLVETLKDDEHIILEKKDSVEEYENEEIAPNTILLKVTRDDKTLIKATILSREGIDADYIDKITATITSIKDSMFAENKNLTKEEIEQIKQDDVCQRVLLGKNVEDNEMHSMLNLLSNYLIFFILLLCLSKIANTISQEKMSKSIEYVLTSISAKEYLIAKVIGICLIVVVQFIFTIAYAIIGLMIASLFNNVGVNVEAANSINLGAIISGRTLGYFVLTFIIMIFTTILQGFIQSVMSAKTTNIQEAGNATLTLVVINLALYTITTALISPLKIPALWVYALSVVPIASMYLVPAMYIIGQANIIQIVLAILVLIASIPVVLKLIQKPFKNAILDFTPKKEKKIEGIEKIIETKEYQERMIERKKSSKKGLAIGFSIILFIILQMFGALLLSMVIPALSTRISFISENSLYLMLYCVIFVVSLYLPYLYLKLYMPKEESVKKKKELNEEELKLRKQENKESFIECLKYIIISIPIMSTIQYICAFAIEKIGVNSDIIDSLGMFENTGKLSAVLMFILIAILPAIFEELFIRKGIMGVLKDKGAIFATIVSAIIFATIHLNISQFIFALLVGILFGIVRSKTQKLYPTMILHFLNNGIAVIEVLLYSHDTFMQIFTYLNIALNAVGFCLLIYMLYKKIMELKDKESIKRLKEELDYRKIKLNVTENLYVFADYTFVVAAVLSVTMFIAIEKILTLM